MGEHLGGSAGPLSRALIAARDGELCMEGRHVVVHVVEDGPHGAMDNVLPDL